jgi:hypothetical protein
MKRVKILRYDYALKPYTSLSRAEFSDRIMPFFDIQNAKDRARTWILWSKISLAVIRF